MLAKKHIAVIAAIALLLFSMVGWLNSEQAVLEYVVEHYNIGGAQIVGGEFISTVGNGLRGYKSFWLFTEDGEKHLARVSVVFRPHIGRIGPDVRVTGIEVTSERK